MADAIWEKASKKSPKTKEGNSYVKQLSLQGTKYCVYVYKFFLFLLNELILYILGFLIFDVPMVSKPTTIELEVV